jgi:hypothetical protein
MRLGETLLPQKSKDKKCCLYEMPYVAAPARVLGDVIAKPTPYKQIPLDAPTRTRNFSWFTSDKFFKRPVLSYQDSYVKFLWGGLQAKGGTGKDYLSCYLRSPTKSTFKCLFKQTWHWCIVMSKSLRNPEDQDDGKKGTLSNQPWLTRVTPTALLDIWILQPIEDVMSLGTDFETHAKQQGSVKEPAAKDFVARKVHTIKLNEVQGTHWNAIKCQEHLGNRPEAVVRKATIKGHRVIYLTQGTFSLPTLSRFFFLRGTSPSGSGH